MLFLSFPFLIPLKFFLSLLNWPEPTIKYQLEELIVATLSYMLDILYSKYDVCYKFCLLLYYCKGILCILLEHKDIDN